MRWASPGRGRLSEAAYSGATEKGKTAGQGGDLSEDGEQGGEKMI
jgi:hypothetical protein